MSVELGGKRPRFSRGYNELTCLGEADLTEPVASVSVNGRSKDQRKTAEESVLDYLKGEGYDLSPAAQVYLPGEVKSVTFTANHLRNATLKDDFGLDYLAVVCDWLSNRGVVLYREDDRPKFWKTGLVDLRLDTVQDLKVNLRDPRHARVGL